MADMDYDKLAKALARALKSSGADTGGGRSLSFDTSSASDTKKITAEISDEMRTIFEIQKDISENSEDYFEYLKKIKRINKEINRLAKEEEKQAKKVSQLTLEATLATGERKEELNKVLEQEKQLLLYIRERNDIEKQNLATISKAVKETRSFKMAIKSTAKDVGKIKDGFKAAYNFLGMTEVFAMAKSIKVSAMQMGVLKTQADGFSKNLQTIAVDTVQYGVDIQKIAELQSSYSDALGRAVILSKEGGKGLAAMSIATGLGAEGTSQMAADLDSAGYSAERVVKFTEQVMNDASSMGINASKLIKVVSSNLKLLNKYNFKGGAASLARMAESTTKMGVSMEMASGFAEKLFDIEGAVEASAQLQVLGGAFSNLADPFKLMYMARNDMEGLTNEIINATKASAKFNSKTGEFEIGGLEMQRLRKVAEATGLNFEELAQSAKNAAKFTAIKRQISYGFDEKTSKFIENTATLDKAGKAKIMVGTTEKYLSALTQQDKQELARIAADKASMEERAKSVVGLDEMLGNTITMLKQLMIPLVEALNNKLKPAIDGLIKKFTDPKFIEGIWAFAKGIGEFIAGVGKFIIEWPKLTAGLLLGIAGVKWFMHGVTLGLGFNSVARAGGMGGPGGAGAAGMFGTTKGAGFGANFSAAAGSKLLKLGGVATTLFTAYSEYQKNKETGMKTSENVGRSALKGTGAGLGAWGGAAAGAAIGSAVPIIGTAIGALIGGALGAWGGGAIGGATGDAIYANDGVVFNPKDKFLKMNDGAMVAGTNVNGNKELAKAIMSSKAPGFNDKDYLMSNRSTKSNVNGVAKVGFDELKVNGAIELKLNSEVATREIGKDLMSDPLFIRELSLKVNKAAASAVGGKT